MHANFILTKYLVHNSANFTLVRTLIDPENSVPHLLAHMVNLSVCASVIPDGVETRSGVSPSVYPLATLVMNYLASMVSGGSLIR